MAHDVELSELDLRYESYRMRNPALEKHLLNSILECGIEEPLEGVTLGERYVLLNGFKRYRCAKKLGIQIIPYHCLGKDESLAIIMLLKISNNKALSILEQAAFIDELGNAHQMGVTQIATELSRSKSWVSMRAGLIAEMSPRIRTQLFRGAFPVYSYMYILRQFMRMNMATLDEIEQFVEALSGKNLSVREIEQLAHGCFRGPESFRKEVLSGNLALPLQRIRQVPENMDGCSEFERVLLGDLEIAQKYIHRVINKSQSPKLVSRAFHAQSHLLTAGLLSRSRAFSDSLRKLHDRSGQA